MSTTSFNRGEIARIYLDIIGTSELVEGIQGLVPTIAIQRTFDGKWFQASDGTWQPTIVSNEMTELDATNLAGRYYFDFNQALDVESTAVLTRYIVKMACLTEGRLEYSDLVFGPGVVSPQVCVVHGTLFTADSRPARTELVRATLNPVFRDAMGRGVQSDRVMMVSTNELGEFSISLVRGGIFRFEIPGIGYDRKVTIPDQGSALFTDL